VRFGKCATVRFFFAVLAAFLIFFRAARFVGRVNMCVIERCDRIEPLLVGYDE